MPFVTSPKQGVAPDVERSLASKSLGPFPKTLRWHQIVQRSGAAHRCPDLLLHQIKRTLEDLCEDEIAIRCVTFLVSLPVSTRTAEPEQALLNQFGIHKDPSENILEAFGRNVPEDHLAKRALAKTIIMYQQRHAVDKLFEDDEWAGWRDADGAAFCDLAMLYFASLNREILNDVVSGSEDTDRFAQEASIITRSFSARWFNACARYEVPAKGSIKWYLGHCLGKLDLEFSRELSDWKEPPGNPWRRKRTQGAALPI